MQNVVILGKSMLCVIVINVAMLSVIIMSFCRMSLCYAFVLNFFLLNVIMSSFSFENSAECRGNNFKDSLLILRQKIVHH